MKIPGPDHPITITAATTRWQALFHGHLIADSGDALVLQESTYPQVIYFPRKDVEMAFLNRTDHRTHCPYKGDACYFTIYRDGEVAENAVWSYEEPYDAMSAIAERVAFYPNHVEIRAVAGQPADRRAEIDDAVLHTDSGSGASQREHWAPNVEGPEADLEGGVR